MYRYGSGALMDEARKDSGFSNAEIARLAPSVLTVGQQAAHLTDRYVQVPTINVIDEMRAAGFLPVEVRQNVVRDVARVPIARHMVRMRHPDAPTRDGVAPELVLINSHDGASAYYLMSGWFRYLCSNGLISGDLAGVARIAHRRDAAQRAIEEAVRLIDRAREGAKRIEAMKARTLDSYSRMWLARRAVDIRWGADKVVDLDDVLTARRWQDAGNDLWAVFNRVQESVLRGGVRATGVTGKVTKARQVRAITEDVRINRELWQVADELIDA